MNFKSILTLSCPRFWLYTAGPYLLGALAGTHFIIENQIVTGDILLKTLSTNVNFWLYFLYFLIPVNIVIYGVNDYFDEETDKNNSKKKKYESPISSEIKKLLPNLSLIIILFGFILSWINGGHITFLLMWAFYFFSIFYSSPPLRFKGIPFIDSLSNILYTIPALIGYVHMTTMFPSFAVMTMLLLWPAAMHLFSAIPDIDADKSANINTTAVYLGKTKSLFLCFLYWGIISILLYILNIKALFTVSLIYPLLIIITFKNTNRIFNIYKLFPYINTLIGFILFIYFLIPH